MFAVFTNAQQVQQGSSIGDMNIKNSADAGLLYPIVYGRLFILDEAVKLTEIQEFTAVYKQEMRKKWISETGGDNLSAAAEECINKINDKNIVGLVFQESMQEIFRTPTKYDWLFFEITPSIDDNTNAALWLKGDAKQWENEEWDEKYCNMPPFIPQSDAIDQMREKLRFYSTKGHMFEDDEGNRHFILDNAYKQFFTTDLWRKKKENNSVYRKLFFQDALEKQPFRKKTNNYLHSV